MEKGPGARHIPRPTIRKNTVFEIFLTTLPLYLMILVGFAAVRSGYIDKGQVGALSQFTFKVCLPALIFSAVAMPRGEAGLNLAFLLAYAAGSMLAMVIGFDRRPD